VPEVDKTREVKILTAFFGLDNGLIRRANIIYSKAFGKDGMPLVFSHELDQTTIEGTDFEVTTKKGDVFLVEAASLLPANEEFELRTVLLIGEYGSYPDNQPVSVKVIGDLITRTGLNLKGKTVDVIPLEEGPVLSYAEYFLIDQDYPYVKKGRGCDCPKDKTKMVVKAVWSGGVRAANGKELGENELKNFRITMLRGTEKIIVTPFLLADLSDNDNNIDICLKEDGIPILIEINENIAIDPNNDKNSRMNPNNSATMVKRTLSTVVLSLSLNLCFAQLTPEQRIQDSVIGWYSAAPKRATVPLQIEGKTFSIKQQDNLNDIIGWMRQTYTPVGGLGTYKKLLFITAGELRPIKRYPPHSYGIDFRAWNVTYDKRWMDAKGHFTPVSEEYTQFYAEINSIPGGWPIS
jgi:hypothetical protein